MNKGEKAQDTTPESAREAVPARQQESSAGENRVLASRIRGYFRNTAKGYAPHDERSMKENPAQGFITGLGEDMAQLASEKKLAELKRYSEDREKLADGLAFMAGRLGATRKDELEGYKDFSEDVKREAIAINKETQALFTVAGDALFRQRFENQQAIENWLSAASERVKSLKLLPSARSEMAQLLATRGQGPEQLATAIDRSIVNLTRFLEEAGNFGTVSPEDQSFGIAPEKRQDVLEAVEFIYQLQVARDTLWKEATGGKNPLDARELDKLKTEITGEDKKTITFDEAFETLKTATTVEKAKEAMTPEIIEAARSYALSEIDASIAQAEEFVKRDPDTILNKKTTSTIFGVGIQGKIGTVYQKIGAAKFGRVVNLDEIARMPIVDFMKTFFDHDLANDQARAEKLGRYTNAFM